MGSPRRGEGGAMSDRTPSVARLGATLVTFALLAFGCTESSPTSSNASAHDEVTFLLPFLNEVDASEYYFINDFGYANQCGFDLTIQEGGGPNPGAVLLTGKVDFAVIDLPSFVAGVSRGLPYIGIGLDLGHTGVSYLSYKETGIEGPQDLPGHIVGVQPGSDELWYLEAIMKQVLTPEQQQTVEIVPSGNSVRPLITHTVDVYALWSNSSEVASLRAQGAEFNIIHASDYVQAMGDIIAVSKTTLAERPDLVRRFVAAWTAALAKVTPENFDFAMRSAVPRIGAEGESRPKAVFQIMWDETMKLEQRDNWETQGRGAIDPAGIEEMQSFLMEQGKIDQVLPANQFYDNSVIESVYGKGQPRQPQIDEVCKGPRGGTYTPPTS
jgi:NitT/TauT family transport system substrate-binding protein